MKELDLLLHFFDEFIPVYIKFEIPIRRISHKEVKIRKKSNSFQFPLKEDRLKQPMSPSAEPRQRNRQGRTVNLQAADQDEDFDVDKPLYGDENQPPTGEVEEPTDQIQDSGGRIEFADVDKYAEEAQKKTSS